LKENNLSAIVFQLIKQLKIAVTKTSIIEEVIRHPDYPSLFAVSDVLLHWKIPNEAYRIKVEQLKDISGPFIAHLKENDGTFVLVKKVTDTEVFIYNELGNKKILIEDFNNVWSGTILAVQTDPLSGELNYKSKRRKEIVSILRNPFAITTLILILLLRVYTSNPILPSLNFQFLILIKTVGVIIATLLLIQSFDANNPLINRLCKKGGNTDCNAILSSSSAKLIEEVSWAEIGFFYFFGTALCLYLNQASLPAIFNLFSLPYTFYSIYYQWKIAKKWCLLCCGIQAILWLEFFAFFASHSYAFMSPPRQEIVKIISILLIPIALWIFLKPYFLRSSQLWATKEKLSAFKNNRDLFHVLLTSKDRTFFPDKEISLLLGNLESEKVLTFVSNPYCSPCKKAYKILQEWLLVKDIQIRIIYADATFEHEPKTKVVHHFLALKHQNNNAKVEEALNFWYNLDYQDYEKLASSFPISHFDSSQIRFKQNEWCLNAQVEYTPAIFINGYKLPNLFQLEDIIYFI
jgi:uncharacterized membrane protein/thiol-disulfide isomerase/thioredoxin